MELNEIGLIEETGDGFAVKLHAEYREGLTNIEGFSFLKILWWANQNETTESDDGLILKKPYNKGPDKMGVFATRSPVRPNSICETVIQVKDIDQEKGAILTYYIDAFPGTPVVDIKPYQPASEIVENAVVPSWCSHWPKNIEESAVFDWESEFNF